jgi:LysR family transcriptional regulator, chromosome initiation inhibitor
MQFEYSALEALTAVIQEGTFEAAAKALNITQSAVSQRIKLLEDRAGAVLVMRGRPCIATEYGQHLCRHVEQVQLLEWELGKNLASLTNSTPAAPILIRIAANNDSLATWFPEVIRRAGSEINLYFDIFSDDQEYTAQKLRSGEALAAITTSEKPLQGCRRLSLGAIEYLAVASPRFAKTHFRDGVTLKAASQAPCLAFNRKDTLPEQWLLKAFGETVPVACHYLPSFTGYLMCCMNGAGWGLMPRSSIAPHLADGSLIELEPRKTVLMSLHWQSSAQSSVIMRLLTEIVQDVARKQLLPDQYRS